MLAALEGDSSRKVTMAMALIDRLQWEPMSQFRASIAGTEDFIGWNREMTALAAIYNTSAGQAKGKKLKKSEHFPVPEVKKKVAKPKPTASVRELDWSKMMGDVGHG